MIAFLATPLGRWAASIAGVTLLLIAIVGGFRWWLAAHDKALLSAYVLKSEKDASDALVKKLQREIVIGQQIRAQADKAAEQLDIESQKRQAADEDAIKTNAGGSVVTRDDLDRLGRVRGAR